MLILIAFLYLVLPVLSSVATGSIGSSRMTSLDLVCGALIGIGIGLIGVAANIGYLFLLNAYFKWQYPSVVRLSETRLMFNHYDYYRERETALMVGPVLIAGFLAAATWAACRWWDKKQLTGSPT